MGTFDDFGIFSRRSHRGAIAPPLSMDTLPTAWTHYHWIRHINIGLDPLPTAWTHYQQHGHITNSMDCLPVFFLWTAYQYFFLVKRPPTPCILFPLLISCNKCFFFL